MAELNVELLTQVRDHILAHPEQLDMSWWGSNRNPCETTACIAGTALMLDWLKTHESTQGLDFIQPSYARNLLGLAPDSFCGSRLFHLDQWPREYEDRYFEADTPAGCAQVVADLIDSVIERGGIWWD